ncbi:MAG: molybdopterin-binding protein [Clostridia bacterium]
MKTVPVNDAVGMVLAHDITQIIPGVYKGSRFKKGYVISEEDVSVLLDMGKENIFVIEMQENAVHEDEAAMRIAVAASGQGIRLKATGEGKVELSAACDGLLKINTGILNNLLDQDEIMFATLHENQLVKAGQVIGGTRVIPLFVNEQVVSAAEKVCSLGTMINVVELKLFKVGLVTTGSEVYTGRIKDAFGPVLEQKFDALGSRVVRQIFASDDEDMIANAICELMDEGVDMIAVTGGMSVDPDDRTPAGIRKAGGKIVTYGAPVLPGAMFMLAYIGTVPVVGLPGCVM